MHARVKILTVSIPEPISPEGYAKLFEDAINQFLADLGNEEVKVVGPIQFLQNPGGPVMMVASCEYIP